MKKINAGVIYDINDIKELLELVIKKDGNVNAACDELGFSRSYAHRIVNGQTRWDINEDYLKKVQQCKRKRGLPGLPAYNRSVMLADAHSIREKWITGNYTQTQLAKMHGVPRSLIRNIILGNTYRQGITDEVLDKCSKVDRGNKPTRISIQDIRRIIKMYSDGYRQVDIAKEIGVSRETVREIKNEKYSEFV